LTAAACAFVAASPVTAFSASSCATVPWAGPLNAGGACEPELEVVVVGVCDVAASASGRPGFPGVADQSARAP
jgi:hypothetical protein